MLNIVIPMAGKGSRFAKEGYQDPKPLIPVGTKRMIELVINNLTPSRPHRFIFICQQEHIDKYDLQAKLEILAPNCIVVGINQVTEGAACTVLCAKDYINNNDNLMIANSDQWVDICIDDYLADMDEKDLDGIIMTMDADDPKWSFVEFDTNGLVKGVYEKIVISKEATVGIYNYKRGSDFCTKAEKMISNGDRSNGEYYVAPVYTYMYKDDNARIGVYNIGSEANGMYGLGIPSDLELFKSLSISSKATNF
ncbi:glycosyltransferase family 2 protein [Yersinia enterocolitica]|uniref:glycosyltransferase family 2 protein n=1 Tax=Yersinia enterocolitica TaxID=630 RepID=UPI00094BAED0|nr:glycosyltransferase family 2 protein [Yersinia enterocolitica]HDM8440038.1 glycosyltransferase family 2 protein [Yersinia enterocolitica]